jgi:hypothetical protein
MEIIDLEWVNRYIKFQNGRRGEVGNYIARVLSFIRDHPGCKAKELKRPDIPEATLFRLLKELVEKRLVEKKSRKGTNLATYRLPEGAPTRFEFRSYEEGYKLAVESCEVLKREWVEQEKKIFDARKVLKNHTLLKEYEDLHQRNKEEYVESGGPWPFAVLEKGKEGYKIANTEEERREFKKEYELDESGRFYRKKR